MAASSVLSQRENTCSQPIALGPVSFSGFPVRSLTRRLGGEGGEWVSAYQAEQRTRLKAVLSPSIKAAGDNTLRSLRPPANTREVSGLPRRKVLDQTFLMKHCYVDEPSDLCVCNISGAGLEAYKFEDFAKFDNVVYINASDNELPLEAFFGFPILRDLELSLNNVVDVGIDLGDFNTLQTLDLSYNSLSGVTLLALGLLPALKELHLTGNNLVALPVDMSRLYSVANEDSSWVRFPVLERLWLDDNKLTDQATFATLAGLRKLKYLNLDNNEMYMIPELKLLGTNTPGIPLPPSSQPSPLNTAPLQHTATSLSPSQPSPLLNTTATPPLQHTATSLQLGPLLNTTPSPPLQHTGATGIHTTEQTPQATQSSPKTTDPATMNQSTEPSKGKNEQVDTVKTASPLHITTRPHSPQIQTSSKLPKNLRRNPLYSRITDAHLYSRPSPLHTHTTTTTAGATQPHRELTPSCSIMTAEPAGTQSHRELTPSCSIMTAEPEVLSHSGGLGDHFGEVKGHDQTSFAPFPELETLSIVNNLILTSDGVLACSSWPALKELIIHGNPLTRACKGMPPLLQVLLVEQCGVSVIRNKPASSKRHSIGSAAKDFKKISSAPPPFIPRRPLPAIEAPPTSDHMMLDFSPSPPHSFATSPSDSQLSSEGGEGSEGVMEGSGGKQQEGIFMTQVCGEEAATTHRAAPQTNNGEPPQESSDDQRPWSGSAAFKAHMKEVKQRFRDVPDCYKGYEVLLDTYNDPTMNVPSDAHGCTRALQYALKHPLVLPDTAQNTHTTHTGGAYLKKKLSPSLQPLTAVHQPSAKVRELQLVLDDIRSHCNTLETNLADALKPQTAPDRRSTSRLQRESKKLLSEMQARYDKVRSTSLKTLRSVAEFGPVSPARAKKNSSSVQRATRVRFSEKFS